MQHTITAAAILLASLQAFSLPAGADVLPTDVVTRLQAGQPVNLIVEYDDSKISGEADAMRQRTVRRIDDAGVLAFKTREYRLLKERVDVAAARPGVAPLKDYSHLPMAFKRFGSLADLEAFIAQPGIRAVYQDRALRLVTAQSLPLVSQPAVADAGVQGAGATVAVIDNGIDYTKAAFGSCTTPGVPAGCKVVVSQNFGSGTTDTGHGTNVSAIVLGVAPAARIAMLNAFSGDLAYSSDIIEAINWAIANRALYNIVAINMSLGDGTKYTSACIGGNPFRTPITNARNAGMQVVAAAGNEAYTNGLSSPACTPGAISVGAVYDTNIGSMSWGSNLCTDATTAADKVACFSNSASFLTLLAPGVWITAAGITQGGTSQASPHVAGAVAVLQSAYPGETLAQIQERMTASGVSITDSRNGIAKPRLNLLEAARPGNDDFANRIALSGNPGSASGSTLLSSKEAGEPDHAGNSGGKSVWWKWTAPAAGQVSLDTHGSSFDTLLAVYTGSSMGALAPVASNDNDGSDGGGSGLLFQAQAGREYAIAVDGTDGEAASATLSWSLNTSASANLAASISGPTGVSPGVTAEYVIDISNAGPQTATNVWVSLTLPAGASYAAGPADCSVNGNIVTCFVGMLTSGTSLGIPIQITWNSIAEAVSMTVSVTSDLPDTVASNDTGTIQIAQETADTDTPTLPQWGTLLLATLLIGMTLKARKPD